MVTGYYHRGLESAVAGLCLDRLRVAIRRERQFTNVTMFTHKVKYGSKLQIGCLRRVKN